MARIYAKTHSHRLFVVFLFLIFNKIPEWSEFGSPDLVMSLLPGISSDYLNPVFSCRQDGDSFVRYQKQKS
jgi:hypothetical protein